MKNNIMGENLCKLRKSAGFRQTDIADFLNVDQSFISKVEKGERPLSSDMLEKLASLFGVCDEAFGSENTEPSTFAIAFRGNNLTRESMEVICAINKIALNLKFMSKLAEAHHD